MNQAVDPDLASSLSKLQVYVETKRALESDTSMVRYAPYLTPTAGAYPTMQSPNSKKQSVMPPSSAQLNIEDLALDFTVPVYDIELKASLILPTTQNSMI
jgi:hypothetical protein